MKAGESVKEEYDGKSLTGKGILFGGEQEAFLRGGYISMGDFLWRSLV